jgi:MFS family permease
VGVLGWQPADVRAFRRVLAGTGLADAAAGLFSTAAVIVVAQTSRSPAAVAVVTAAATVPWLLFAVPAGVLADRVSRGRAIGWANAGRAAVMLGASAALLLRAPAIPVLVGAVFAVASLQTVVDTAAEALVPELVPADRLSQANGGLSVATRISNQFAGPLGAGVLTGVSVAAPGVVGGLACLAAAALVVGVRLPVPAQVGPPAGRDRRRGSDLTRGFALVARRPALATIVGVGAVTTLANGAFLTVFVVHAIAPGPLGLTPAQYGLLLGAVGLGSATGALLTGRVEALVGRPVVLVVSRLGWALVFAAPVVATGVPLAAVVLVGSGFGGMWAVAAMSIRQTAVAPGERGQVAGVNRLVQYGAAPVGAVLGAALAGRLDARVVFAVAAAVTLATVVPVRRWLGSGRITAGVGGVA